MGHVEYRSWSVRDVVQSMNGGGRGHIVIPSFQRGLVWNEEKRSRFIDSVKKGLPVGVILLFVDGTDDGGRTRYRLVDGLQRCSTLRRYTDSMFEYFTSDDVPAGLLSAATSLIPGIPNADEQQALVRQVILMWVRAHNAKDEAFLSAFSLYQRLCSALNVGSESINQGVFKACEQFVHGVHAQLDVREKQIGVIEFTGDKADLPVIFDRLNTGGVFLNKYDVLAADWDHIDDLEIKNEQIVNAIKDKYRAFFKLGLEFEDRTATSIEEFNTKDFEYSLFEYVFGLGKVLRNKFPRLYGGRREGGSEVDAIAFNLTALTNDKAIVDLGDFAKDYKKYPSLERYFDSLVSASESILKVMAPVFDMVVDKPRRKPWHTDFQICALVAGLFREHFDDDLSVKPTWTADALKIRRNLPQRYLFDVVSAYWRGSGDSKARLFVHGRRILEGIEPSAITATLEGWFSESIKQSLKKDEPDQTTELLLKYLGAAANRHAPGIGQKFAIVSIVEEAELRPLNLKRWNAANIILVAEGGRRLVDPCGALADVLSEKPRLGGDVREWLSRRFAKLSENIVTEFF